MYNRKSIRLKEYDYSSEGMYFVTICTHNKECVFGEMKDGEMVLSEYGEIVPNEWMRTPELRENVELDEFVVMPNHLHGIIIICRGVLPCGGVSSCKGVLQYAPTYILRSPSQTIGAIVRGYKSAATKRINVLKNMPNHPLWQRNFYEHVIRNEQELSDIRNYIIENPMKWELDKENPQIRQSGEGL